MRRGNTPIVFGGSVAAADRGMKRYAQPLQLNSTSGISGALSSAFPGRFNPSSGARSFENPGFRENGMNPYGPPLAQEDDINQKITVQGRRYKPLGAQNLGATDLGPPSEKSLAFVYRTRAKNTNLTITSFVPSGPRSSMIGEMVGDYGNEESQQETPFGTIIQGEPSLAATPAQLNFALAELYFSWIRTNVDACEHVTAQMLYYGTRNLPYLTNNIKKLLSVLPGFIAFEGFSCDGVPRSVIAVDGTAPQYTDGLQAMGNGATLAGYAAKDCLATVTQRGSTPIFNYWGPDGMRTGNRLYVVLKKYDLEAYRHPSNQNDVLQYNLMAKPHDQYRDAASMYRTLKMPEITVDGVKQFARPFQLGFVATGGVLDREHAHYVDEWGNDAWGVIVYIGTVLSPGIVSTYRPSLKAGNLRPYMDNRQAMRDDEIQIILNADDGFKCHY